MKAAKAEKSVGNYLHGQDYMVYAHLQLAQDREALVVLDDMRQANNFNPNISGGNYALAAARGLMTTDLPAEDIARRAMAIAADICVYTNGNLTLERIRA